MDLKSTAMHVFLGFRETSLIILQAGGSTRRKYELKSCFVGICLELELACLMELVQDQPLSINILLRKWYLT